MITDYFKHEIEDIDIEVMLFLAELAKKIIENHLERINCYRLSRAGYFIDIIFLNTLQYTRYSIIKMYLWKYYILCVFLNEC